MIVVKKASSDDLDDLRSVYDKYEAYFQEAPLFMVRQEETIEDLKEWMAEENRHLWIAYLHGKAVGFMQIQEQGESYIAADKGVMNITGAYVYSEERSSGIGQTLLGRVFSYLEDHQYKLCGVDFESFNIQGSKFWNKHFKPYTYSLVRRIDERI